MRHRLKLHPDCPPGPVTAIEVEAVRSGTTLALAFIVKGAIADIAIAAPAEPRFADELWRRTCFELFVRTGDAGYHEYNFSPSGEWAAYAFERHRSGMVSLAGFEPIIRAHAGHDSFELLATVDLDDLPVAAPWRAGLSAVIEASDGTITYWALAHPPGRPDFHHEDCFAVALSPAG